MRRSTATHQIWQFCQFNQDQKVRLEAFQKAVDGFKNFRWWSEAAKLNAKPGTVEITISRLATTRSGKLVVYSASTSR